MVVAPRQEYKCAGLTPLRRLVQGCKRFRLAFPRCHPRINPAPTNANRCRALLSHMFEMAEVWGERSPRTNPCRHVKKYHERKRERFLSAEEFARLAEALITADGREPLEAIAAMRLGRTAVHHREPTPRIARDGPPPRYLRRRRGGLNLAPRLLGRDGVWVAVGAAAAASAG